MSVIGMKRTKQKQKREPPDWLDECICGETGRPLSVLANVLIGLRAAMPLVLSYDEMLCVPMLMQPVEIEIGKPVFKPHACTDVDIGAIQEKLQHLGLKRIAKDVVHQAVDIRAYERRFHPVRDYLDALEWDGEKRLEGFFPTYFGSADTEYACAIGTMFLTSMVARIFEPGLRQSALVLPGMANDRRRVVHAPIFLDRCAHGWGITRGKGRNRHQGPLVLKAPRHKGPLALTPTRPRENTSERRGLHQDHAVHQPRHRLSGCGCRL